MKTTDQRRQTVDQLRKTIEQQRQKFQKVMLTEGKYYVQPFNNISEADRLQQDKK